MNHVCTGRTVVTASHKDHLHRRRPVLNTGRTMFTLVQIQSVQMQSKKIQSMCTQDMQCSVIHQEPEWDRPASPHSPDRLVQCHCFLERSNMGIESVTNVRHRSCLWPNVTRSEVVVDKLMASMSRALWLNNYCISFTDFYDQSLSSQNVRTADTWC